MAFFKTACNVISCQHHVQQKGTEGYCNKGIFDSCPMTTKPGNDKVKDYHDKRRQKFKK